MTLKENILLVITLGFTAVVQSCSSGGGSASGQSGEAFVVGVAFTKNGTPASNRTVMLAENSYSKKTNSGNIFESETDERGNFQFSINDKGRYTLSDRMESTILYTSDIVVNDEDTVNLDTVRYQEGIEIIVVPWWEDSTDEQFIYVEGTSWEYDLNADGFDTLFLPEDELTLFFYSDEFYDTSFFSPEDGYVLGDSLLLSSPELSLKSSTIELYEECSLSILNYSDSLEYFIIWDEIHDTTTQSKENFYLYEEYGHYTIQVYAYSTNQEWLESPEGTIEITVLAPQFTKEALESIVQEQAVESGVDYDLLVSELGSDFFSIGWREDERDKVIVTIQDQIQMMSK